MRVLTLAAVCLSLLALASAADAATPVRGAAPAHLHGFLLRADEPVGAPKPLPSEPGLLRWTPIEGADGYQVWLIDIPKMEVVFSNVLDEREFYTFHRSSNWIGTIRWRIRAIRADNQKSARQNGLPAIGYGPWSPVYSSTNPAYSGGTIKLGATVSDVIASGDPSSPAHRLMPAFTFTGDTAIDGTKAELFRVYVFTDRDCLNLVYKSAIIGGPAYAPPPDRPPGLPSNPTALPSARANYLRDGSEPDSFMFDGMQVKTTESEPSATPTTAVPADSDSSTGTSAPAGPPQLTITGNLGAPVDLWDTDWPSGGYYWTVVAVAAVSPGALTTATSGVSALGATSLSAISG